MGPINRYLRTGKSQRGDGVDTQPDMRESVALFMANVHKSVNDMSEVYLTNERRYNYTTPKSFLEQIKLYQNLLQNKFDELQAKTVRLENGLEKLKSTSAQVGIAST